MSADILDIIIEIVCKEDNKSNDIIVDTPPKVKSSKATSSKVTPSKVTQPKVTPSKVTQPKVTSSKATSSKVTPSKVTSPKVTFKTPNSEPIKNELIKSEPIKNELIKSEPIKNEPIKIDISESLDVSETRKFLQTFQIKNTSLQNTFDKLSDDIAKEEVNIEKFLKDNQLEELIQEMKGGNLDDKFSKYFRLLALKNKLISNAFQQGKYCYNINCQNDIKCEKCKIISIIRDKYKNDINKIKLPDYNYINCLANKVKKAIEEKSTRDTPFMNKLLTGSQYRYNNYISSTAYSGFVSIFFNLFFNESACVLTNNILRIMEYDGTKIIYDPKIFNIIKDNLCKKRFILIDLGVPNHANSLIFDTEKKCIYHYEPNGSSMLVGQNHIITKDWFTENGKYIKDFINAFMNNIKLDLSKYEDDKRNLTELKNINKELMEQLDSIKDNDNITKNMEQLKNKYKDINVEKEGENIKLTYKGKDKNVMIEFTHGNYKGVLPEDLYEKIKQDKKNNLNLYNKLVEQFNQINKLIFKKQNLKYFEDSITEINQDASRSTKPYLCEKLLYSLFKEKLPDYKFYPALALVRNDMSIIQYTTQYGFDPDGYCQTINFFYLFMILYNNNLNFDPNLIMAKWMSEYNYEVSTKNIDVKAEQEKKLEYEETDIARNFVRNLVIIFYQYFYKYIALLFKKCNSININNFNKNENNNMKIIKGLLTKFPENIRDKKYNEINNIISSYNNIQYIVDGNDMKIIYTGKNKKELLLDDKNYWTRDLKEINNDIILMEYSRWILYNDIADVECNNYSFYNNINEFIKSHYQLSDVEKDTNDYTISGTRFRKAIKDCEKNNLTEKNFEDIFKKDEYKINEQKYKEKYMKYKLKYLNLKNMM
jgi:hypothetical protein